MANKTQYQLEAVLSLNDKDFKRNIKTSDKSTKELGKSLTGISKEYKPTISIKDNATSTLKKAKSQLNELKQSNIFTTISAKDNATGSLRRIKQELNSITGKVHNVAVNIKQNGAITKGKEMLGGAMMGAGAGMLGIAGIGFGAMSVAKNVMGFDEGMKSVQAISGATQEEFKQLSAKAKEMGAKTKFSATESAEAMKYMAMAGWNTQQMLGGISGVMNLAAASGEDLGTVSDIVTDALSAFGMKAEESSHFADVLAMTSRMSNTNVAMMGETFKYVAPVAGALGYKCEDVSVAIGMMASAGIKSSQAGTTLRSVLTNLNAPTKETALAMQYLGVEMKDKQGKMKSLSTVLRDLREKYKQLDEQQGAEIAQSIAGKEAMSGFLAMMKTSDEVFDQYEKSIADCNEQSQKMADIMQDHLLGDLVKLKSATEGFFLAVSGANEKGKGGIREFVQEVIRLVSNFTQAIEKGETFKGVIELVKDSIHDLIGTTVKFDGIGSIIAGGTLYFGLKKILKLTRRISTGLKGLTLANSGNLGSVGDIATTAKSMTMTANVVYVNGREVGGGGVADYGGGSSGGGKGGKPSKKPKGKIGRFAGKVGGKIATIGGNLIGDVGINAISKAGKIGGKVAMPFLKRIPLLSVGLSALDYATTTKEDKGGAIGRGIGGTVGAVVGGAIGSIVPGAGTAVGAVAGGIAGDWIGNKIAYMLDPNDPNNLGMKAQNVWNTVKDSFGNMCKQMEDTNRMHGDSIMASNKATADGMGVTWKGFSGFFTNEWDYLCGVVSGLWDSLKEKAHNASDGIYQGLTSCIETLKSAWKGVANWFDSNVFAPLKNGIKSATDGASGLIDRGVNYFKGGKGKNSFVGSSYYQGGLTAINEHGGEIVDLPTGSRIYPASTTEKMLQQEINNTSNKNSSATVNVSGNTFVVREDADIDKIAHVICQKFQQASVNYGGGY